MRYLKDMRGRVVQAPTYKPSGDQNPEGRAAKRRRKQMERKNPPAEVQHAADSSKMPEAVSQDLACDPIVDVCQDGGAIHTWTDDDGEIRQRYIPREQVVLESSPTNGPGLAQRLYVNRQMDPETLAALMTTKPGQVIPVNDPAAFMDLWKDGTVSVGIDPGRPDGDVTTVAIRKGGHMLILDEASQVPPEAWDDVMKRARDKMDNTIAAALYAGQSRVVNTAHPLRKPRRLGHSILAAALLATMGTTPKK